MSQPWKPAWSESTSGSLRGQWEEPTLGKPCEVGKSEETLRSLWDESTLGKLCGVGQPRRKVSGLQRPICVSSRGRGRYVVPEGTEEPKTRVDELGKALFNAVPTRIDTGCGCPIRPPGARRIFFRSRQGLEKNATHTCECPPPPWTSCWGQTPQGPVRESGCWVAVLAACRCS